MHYYKRSIRHYCAVIFDRYYLLTIVYNTPSKRSEPPPITRNPRPKRKKKKKKRKKSLERHPRRKTSRGPPQRVLEMLSRAASSSEAPPPMQSVEKDVKKFTRVIQKLWTQLSPQTIGSDRRHIYKRKRSHVPSEKVGKSFRACPELALSGALYMQVFPREAQPASRIYMLR